MTYNDEYCNSMYSFYVDYIKMMKFLNSNYEFKTIETSTKEIIQFDLDNFIKSYAPVIGRYKSDVSIKDTVLNIEFVADDNLVDRFFGGHLGNVEMPEFEIINRARRLLKDTDIYEDELMIVERCMPFGDIDITRKAIPFRNLSVENPVIMIDTHKNTIFRYHGEFNYLSGRLYYLTGKDTFNNP